MFERSSKCVSSSEKIHILWSRWTETQGDEEGALKILEKFLEKKSKCWEAKVEIAYIELRRGEELNCKLQFMDASEDAYTVSLSAGSDVVIKYSDLLMEQGEVTEAELLLEQALEKDKKSVRLHWALVNLHSVQKQPENVVKCLKAAISNVAGASKIDLLKKLLSVGKTLGVQISDICKIEKSLIAGCEVFKGACGQFQCMNCDSVLTTRFNLKRHIVLMHEPGANLECDRCRCHFDTGELMMRHKKRKNKCLIKCNNCSYRNKSRQLFSKHKCFA